LSIATIVTELKTERDRINDAISTLEGTSSNGTARYNAPNLAKAATPKRHGGMTAAGRKRISDMMKKRWAERRKKSSAKK